MSGWLYLIKNGDLYKIGITKNITARMRQLKPDKIISTSFCTNFRELEKFFHKRYKKVGIPQTEYFRLESNQVRDYLKYLSLIKLPKYVALSIFFESFFILFLIFIPLVIINFLINNDLRIVISNSINITDLIIELPHQLISGDK